jgi:type II secretory pathway component PulF
MSALKKKIRQQLSEEYNNTASTEAKELGFKPNVFSRAKRTDIANFYRSFAILVGANYPIPRALAMLAKSTHNKDLAASITQIGTQVEQGNALSKAMARFPWYFDSVAVNIIKGGEASGKLAEGVEYLASMLDLEQEIRDRATQTLSYPVIVGGLASLVVGGTVYFAIPMFAQHLANSGLQPSTSASFIFAISDIARSPLVLSLLGVSALASVLAVTKWRRSNPTAFYKAVGRLPVIGKVMMQASITRFVHMLHMMLVNGVNMLQSLDLAKGSVDNAYLQRAIDAMHENVEAGRSMSEALEGFSDLPPIFTDMISLGEQTGRMDEILPALATSLRNDLNRTATRVSTIAEPVLIASLGFVVLGIVLAFFVPYFDMLRGMSVG